MNYTEQDQIQNQLGRDLSDGEAANISLLVARVNKWIDEQVGSTFGDVTASTRLYDGGFRNLFIDGVRDISKVESLTYDSDWAEEATDIPLGSLLLMPLNQDVCSWIKYKSGERFVRGNGNIRVTGKFSLSDCVPDDIQGIATDLVAGAVRDISLDGLESESIEGYSRKYAAYKFQSNENFDAIFDSYNVRYVGIG